MRRGLRGAGRAAGLAAAGVAAAVAASGVACDDVSVHVYSAHLFVASEGCLQPSTGLDLLSGPATGDNCAPACLTAPTPDGEAVYVSTVCPPYPQGVTVEAQDAAVDAADPCVAALGAFAAGATCGSDAAAPDAGPEAAADSGAAADAERETGADATAP